MFRAAPVSKQLNKPNNQFKCKDPRKHHTNTFNPINTEQNVEPPKPPDPPLNPQQCSNQTTKNDLPPEWRSYQIPQVEIPDIIERSLTLQNLRYILNREDEWIVEIEVKYITHPFG